MRLLVTGGAGFVGSVCATLLAEEGHEVVIVDNLSTGNEFAIPQQTQFVQGDIADLAPELLGVGKSAPQFDGVLHFAALSLVGESVAQPEKYWQKNTVTTLSLLEAMRHSGTQKLIFSSTAATYGEPKKIPITEDAPTHPTNPYGATKLAIDMAISSYAQAHGLAAASLRYFNVAGAYKTAGEHRSIETHLIPLTLQVALGERDHISIFGTDWPTPDGTCIRDYIHALDLARAHLLALEHVVPGKHEIFNLGSGSGFSVRNVIAMCQDITGREIPVVETERRPGDPAVLVASSEKAVRALDWRPDHNDLKTIVTDAWEYAQAYQQYPYTATN